VRRLRPPLRALPVLQRGAAEALPQGSGAGILFKGSGFYQTDYKRAAAPAEGDKAASGGQDKTGGTDKGTEKKGAEKAPAGGQDGGSGKDSGSSGKAAEKPADTPREKRPGGDVPKGPASGDAKPR
jgi:predicted nucleic acid-binding Zn ribbon protein